jgi:uncharacterized protein
MSLQESLREDLKDAMRKREEIRVSTIRLLLASVRNEEIALQVPKGGMDDPGIHKVISKEAKRRKESIEAFQMGNRPDLVAKEESELAILQAYLPSQLTKEEIVAAVTRVIDELGASGPQDIGKVMPRLMAEMKGRADGKQINAIVSEMLKR